MHAPPTFLINLDRSTDRLAKSVTALDNADLAFERVAAVDGRALDPKAGQSALVPFGRILNPGEVGCFLSHRACAAAFLKTEAPVGLVLEDDLAFRPQGAAQLAHLWTTLDQLPAWDLINLGRTADKHRDEILPTVWADQQTTLYRAHYFPTTTTAILWSREGAQKFLDQTNDITMPVDLWLRQWACKTGLGLAFDPSPITIRGEDSEIDKMQTRRKDRGLTYHLLKVKRQVTNHLNARKSRKAWQ